MITGKHLTNTGLFRELFPAFETCLLVFFAQKPVK